MEYLIGEHKEIGGRWEFVRGVRLEAIPTRMPDGTIDYRDWIVDGMVVTRQVFERRVRGALGKA